MSGYSQRDGRPRGAERIGKRGETSVSILAITGRPSNSYSPPIHAEAPRGALSSRLVGSAGETVGASVGAGVGDDVGAVGDFSFAEEAPARTWCRDAAPAHTKKGATRTKTASIRKRVTPLVMKRVAARYAEKYWESNGLSVSRPRSPRINGMQPKQQQSCIAHRYPARPANHI